MSEGSKFGDAFVVCVDVRIVNDVDIEVEVVGCGVWLCVSGYKFEALWQESWSLSVVVGICVDVVNVVVEECIVIVFSDCMFECVCNAWVVCGMIQDELFFNDDAIESANMSTMIVTLSGDYSLLDDGILTNFKILASEPPHDKFE